VGTQKIDTDRMRRLASDLDAMRERLNATAGLTDRYGDSFGSSEVADAFGEFANGWSHRREALGRDLDGAAGALRTGAEAYEKAEADISAGTRGECP
jgi:hypothetical protein